MIIDRISARDVLPTDISELIATRQAELNELEYKREIDADLLKAACAIANHGGGYIVIGIAENENHVATALVSVSDPQATADRVRQRLRDGLSPRPIIEVVPVVVESVNTIVIRIAPQSPPHMVSVDKRSDFYNRYDATSDRMRYEEIEQRFRDKFNVQTPDSGFVALQSTPQAIIETMQGRKAFSTGATTALTDYVAALIASGEPVLGVVAVGDEIARSVTENDARKLFEQPSYNRRGGWLAIHPTLPVKSMGGRWEQDYEGVARTFLNSSGDFMLEKSIDEVLCWRQSRHDFLKSPRIYPNALIELLLSYCYSLSDIASHTEPKSILIELLLSRAANVQLPLGEGGSVWFDAPVSPPARLGNDLAVALPISLGSANTLRPRHLAFELAAQIYAFFGHERRSVPFSDGDTITFEAEGPIAKITASRSALQRRLRALVDGPSRDFSRRIERFVYDGDGDRKHVGFSREFIDDWASNEDRLESLVGKYSIADLLSDDGRRYPVITNDGLKLVPHE